MHMLLYQMSFQYEHIQLLQGRNSNVLSRYKARHFNILFSNYI